MAPQFIGREIKVTVAGGVKAPVSFVLDGKEYKIVEIQEAWHDHGYGLTPPYRPHWWQRRHRNYYRIKTDTGETFEIYCDRGTGLSYPERRKWYLYRRL